MAGREEAKSIEKYWSLDSAALLDALHGSQNGLSGPEAARRLAQYGPNALVARRQFSAFRAFLGQIVNPLVLVLIFAAVVSLTAGEWIDAGIIGLIVLVSSFLSFFQEYSASRAGASDETEFERGVKGFGLLLTKIVLALVLAVLAVNLLLKKDLNVLITGIREGRRTFANTIKYIHTTISANFGNMLSMAGASLFCPFCRFWPSKSC